MILIISALSFLPMLLITLAIHEFGHLMLARICGARTGGFQIGAGWRIISHHTGSVRAGITPETRNLNPDAPGLRRGDAASIYVTAPDGPEYPHTYRCVAILPRNAGKLPRDRWPEAGEHNNNYMRLNGRVREIQPDHIRLADMEWSLRIMPVMAGVILPEDPTGRIPEAYNNLGWRKKTAITAAGVTANMGVMILALALLAALPLHQPETPVLEVRGVVPDSPAQRSGLIPGDLVLRVGNLAYPNFEEIRSETVRAAESGRAVQLGVHRKSGSLSIRVRPDPETRLMGVSLRLARPVSQPARMSPGAISQRMLTIGQRYASTLGRMAVSMKNREEREAAISGPLMGSYHTARSVERAGLHAWLVILATLNLGVAATNIIPIPPLDGYRMVTETVQSIRGRPVNPRVERAAFLTGVALIFVISLYLFIQDMKQLMQQ